MAVTAPRPLARPRTLTILGSTGSVGRNTLALLHDARDRFRVEALTAHRNVALLARQAREVGARMAVIADPALGEDLAEALAGSGIIAAAGPGAVVEAAERPADWVMSAIVGAAGLAATLAAVRRGAVVALANKESLVCAGELMMAEVRACGATLLPVDSEHNAIFQVFDFARPERIRRIILTASGGPFREHALSAMAVATPAQAVAHPNWSMGAKISVDSATLMNKGLELIEAHHLFGFGGERIDIVIHPQSVVHSMVEYVDGSVLAQMGSPDMRTPIAYTLGWPDRMCAPVTPLDLTAFGGLTFEPPDAERFPALRLARHCLESGGGAPTVLNAANEVAVGAFLGGRLGFLDIARVVEATLARVSADRLAGLDEVMAVDAEARAVAEEITVRRGAR